MRFHRLLEEREIDGRLRQIGSLIDYRGPPVSHFEPLDIAEHNAWIEAMRWRGSFPDESRAAA